MKPIKCKTRKTESVSCNLSHLDARTFLAVFSLLLLLIMAACSSVNDSAQQAPRPVVESYLVPGQPAKVKITKENVYHDNDTLSAIADLSVLIIAENGEEHQLTYSENGVYVDSSLSITQGQVYQLQFDYQGKQISAVTEIPPPPSHFAISDTVITINTDSGGSMPGEQEPLTFTWDNPEDKYHLLTMKNIEMNPDPVSLGGDRTFKAEPTQNNQKKMKFLTFTHYGMHEVVLYRILPEYAALYDDNGTSSTSLTSVSSNIEDGLGIFTGVNVLDTLHIRVAKHD